MLRQAAVFALLCYCAANLALSQEPPAKPFKIRVTSNEVNVRSDPDANSRVVLRVLEDSVLNALELQGDWYRIEPPRDVFCYVSAGYINRTGNTGTVNVASGTLRVRLGSLTRKLDPTRAKVVSRLQRGEQVEIVGQDGDWYQIKPPAGVDYYISADHTKPVDSAEAARLEANPPSKPPVVSTVTPAPVVSPDQPIATGGIPMVGGRSISEGPTPKLSDVYRPAAVPETPARTLEDTTTTERTDDEPLLARTEKPVETKPSEPEVQPIRRGPFGNPLPPSAAMTAKPKAEPRPAEKPIPDPVVNKPIAAAPPVAESQPTAQPVNRTPQPATPQPQQVVTQPQPVVAQPAPRPKFERFLAEGLLQPNFSLPMSANGLRYELRHPFDRRRVVAYAEFGASVRANPTSLVGQYVGISGQTFVEPKTGARIIRVTSVTAMPAPQWNPRRTPR